MTSPLTVAMRWKNLSILHGGCIAASRTDRLRFLKTYLSKPSPFAVDLRAIVSNLETKGQRHRFRLWASRAKRCLAENREFTKVKAGDLVGFARRDFWEPNQSAFLMGTRGMLEGLEAKIIKDSTTTTVGVWSLSGRNFYVKRYNRQGLAYAFKNLFRASRGRRGWIVFNSLRIRDIAAPLPLAYLEKRRRRVLFESTVIAAAVPGENLADIAKRFREGKVSLRDKRALIDELARFIRRMHDRRVAHRDLKPQNIIAEQARAARWRMGIVDADGIRLGRVSARARDKNIARVARSFLDHPAVTRADGLRFLLAYLSPGETTRWKKFWRRLARRASFRQGKPV